MSIPNPPDRGYDERRARATLNALIGSELRAIHLITLEELRTSDDGRGFHADLAIELGLEHYGAETVALFAWGVNFGVEQLCVWQHPLRTVWPQHAESPTYDVPSAWWWPRGRLVAAEGFKLRPSEIGINRADLRFDAGGLSIKTGGLDGNEPDALLLSPLD